MGAVQVQCLTLPSLCLLDDSKLSRDGFIALAVTRMPKDDVGGNDSDNSGGERGWREYAAGGGSAIVAITCTFPINKAMFRQQERTR